MKPSARRLLLVPLAAGVVAFLLYPLAALVAASLHAPRGVFASATAAKPAAPLANYLEIFRNPLYREALVHSVILSVAVALAATLLCLGPAWLLARHDFPGKRLVRAGFALPMSLSGIMVGFLAVIMLGRVGFIPQMTQSLTGHAWLAGASYQLSGLVIAYLYFEIPRGMLSLESALRKFDPNLDAAARTLGAGRWQRFFWITLPLIAPALVSTFAVTFSVSLGSFGVALILSKRFTVLPLELYAQFTNIANTPLASAMAVTLGTTALVSHLGANWWTNRILSARA